MQKSDIITAINRFPNEIIEYELQTFQNQNDPNLTKIILFYENLKTKLNSLGQNECIMRLGQGSSILGITMFLNFSKNKKIINIYKELEVVYFNAPDQKSPGYGHQQSWISQTNRANAGCHFGLDRE